MVTRDFKMVVTITAFEKPEEVARSHLINARTSRKRQHLRSETVETQPNHHFPPVAPAQVLWFFCHRAIYEISSSYLGLNPAEHSSGGKQRLGHISKQGNRMMRWLLVEAAYVAVRKDPELKRIYQRLAFRRGRKMLPWRWPESWPCSCTRGLGHGKSDGTAP